uniref:Uncharacterized protein n=1 Tax=Acanthochromis polyacanthus TaxID=80966 RepID=A0A3Q1EYH3_9TELE
IKSLRQDNSITILPANKGRTTVIMDTDTYDKQLTNMLENRNTYEVLQKDPTEEKKRTLKTLLKPLLELNKITPEAYSHLTPTANVTPRIYGTPKIHKKDTPLCPIVDSIGSHQNNSLQKTYSHGPVPPLTIRTSHSTQTFSSQNTLRTD